MNQIVNAIDSINAAMPTERITSLRSIANEWGRPVYLYPTISLPYKRYATGQSGLIAVTSGKRNLTKW
jgi:hypothetical protein